MFDNFSTWYGGKWVSDTTRALLGIFKSHIYGLAIFFIFASFYETNQMILKLR